MRQTKDQAAEDRNPPRRETLGQLLRRCFWNLDRILPTDSHLAISLWVTRQAIGLGSKSEENSIPIESMMPNGVEPIDQ
jgi:hypothetical protein